MPGKVKVRIVAGRNLPPMDKSTDLADAFVEVKLGNTVHKTEVYKKSLNPQWNSEWFRFELDDEDLQDEPLQIRVLDHDTYSANDAIGKVYIDLMPLLSRDTSRSISGWFPIYDTMHGIRGELNATVKVDLFTDFNKFRQSSCGVQFFCTPGVPAGFTIQAIQGFVEELVVNEDPDYQWIDKIRSMRASNEARQVAFSKLSGELQRKIGLKVLEMGGNSLIGYRQCFDLEGESGIVVRAIGTSVSLCKCAPANTVPASASAVLGGVSPHSASSPVRDMAPPTQTPFTSYHQQQHHHDDAVPPAHGPSSPMNVSAPAPTLRYSPGTAKPVPTGRRSSESEPGTPPRGSIDYDRPRNSLTGSSGSGGALSKPSFIHRPTLQQHAIDVQEFPFFTTRSFPPGFLVHLGGVVSARSVKLLSRIHNPDEPETRDAWWGELRTEVRSHARALGCHAVIGYKEQAAICNHQILLLSASGTAAVVDLNSSGQSQLDRSLDKAHFERVKTAAPGGGMEKLHVDVNLANQMAALNTSSEGGANDTTDDGSGGDNCSLCHIPYSDTNLPFQIRLTKCALCKRNKVPDVLFTTIEPPKEFPFVGRGSLVQARICRPKGDMKKEEPNAKEVSDGLPFMEYELYTQLFNKLKVTGMNALFGLDIQFSVGEKLIVALATGTGVLCSAIPPPPLPKILGKMNDVTRDVEEMQRKVQEAIARNKDLYNLYLPETESDQDVSEEGDNDDGGGSGGGGGGAEFDPSTGNKETFVFEIDDTEDAEVVSVLLDPPVPDGFCVVNTETIPGLPNIVCNLQTFTRVWKGQLSVANSKAFSNMFDHLLRGLFFKLRKLVPCAICHISFDIDLPDEDEIQVSITGVCTGIGEPTNSCVNGGGLVVTGHPSDTTIASKDKTSGSSTMSLSSSQQEPDLMFPLEMVTTGPVAAGATSPDDMLAPSQPPRATPTLMSKSTRHSRNDKRPRFHLRPSSKEGVDLTPLAYIPGAKIESYLGHLNFFIIRESTSVRMEGGLNGFMQGFLAEVMAICRAHVQSLGGNALVSFFLSECVLDDNLHKNQSQCLVNVYGDVVQVSYDTDNQLLTTSTAVKPAKDRNKSSPSSSPPFFGHTCR